MDEYIKIYGKHLYGLCMNLTGNRETADDLYQETWLKALKYFERYDQSKEFKPWITTICINTYKDMLRKKKRNPIFNLFRDNGEKDGVLENVPARPETDYSPLHQAVDRLPSNLRITVILFYFYEMDQKQVAESLGVPPGTVKSRLSTARSKLKEMLSDETEH